MQVCGQEHYITNVNDLRGLFKTKSAKIKYLYKILKVSIDVILSCKWLLLAFKKGLEKRSRVREKSVKSQGILIWIMSGNPEQMSLVMRKPAFCICENKDADQLRSNRGADQRLCFRYKDSKIPRLPKFEISSLYPSSVAVQPGLCWTWSDMGLINR